jgi:TBC1 domain family member 15
MALIQQKPTLEESSERPSSAGSGKSHKASSYLLAWLPEHSLGTALDAYIKVEASDGGSPPKRTPLVPAPFTPTHPTDAVGAYAFAVPLSEIYSLLIRPPSIGWWYGSVVINTRSGDGFPALFFHDDECQSTILQKKRLVKESFDPFGDSGTFWGGDEVLRWIKRYLTVERSADPNVFLIDPSPEDKVGFGGRPLHPTSPKSPTANAKAGPSNTPKSNEAGMDPLMKTLKQARWGFLEKMSQVTTFTRKTAQDLIIENPRVHPQLRRLMRNPEVQTLQDEFDSARVYLARWAMGIAEESERGRQQRIWTARDVLETESSDVGEFEILEAANMSLVDKRKPVTLKEWNGWFSEDSGRLQITQDEVKDRIFHGGLSPSDGVRKEAWLFLLGVYEWDSTQDERRALMNSKRDEFIRLKGAWWERVVDGHASPESAEYWKEQKGRIGKSSLRHSNLVYEADRAHLLGYVI